MRSHSLEASAHPRSRGENAPGETYEGTVKGSSPLTRGKPPRILAHQGYPGLIPAHAGKTGQGARPSGPRRAHPRSRGENHARVTSSRMLAGSSPLTRGKQVVCLDKVAPQRLIPAHAGKTTPLPAKLPARRAHPRSRGENCLARQSLRLAIGSSPLTRGKRHASASPSETFRLIPAHAGKTEVRHTPSAPPAAHPRSRGENSPSKFMSLRTLGSSPLTRGKRRQRVDPRAFGGLIPAHAGKTISEHANSDPAQAHPRSRGENWLGNIDTLGGFGSSPLTRGKPFS